MTTVLTYSTIPLCKNNEKSESRFQHGGNIVIDAGTGVSSDLFSTNQVATGWLPAAIPSTVPCYRYQLPVSMDSCGYCTSSYVHTADNVVASNIYQLDGLTRTRSRIKNPYASSSPSMQLLKGVPMMRKRGIMHVAIRCQPC